MNSEISLTDNNIEEATNKLDRHVNVETKNKMNRKE